MGLGAPTGTAPAAQGVTDTDQPDDQSQDQGQQAGDGAAAPAQQSQSERFFQGAFTQKNQIVTALAKELGLPKDASQADFIEALATRSTPPMGEDEEETPEQARRRRDLDERSWGIAAREHGDALTARARELYDALRRRRDPGDFVSTFASAVAEMVDSLQASANPPAGQAPQAPASTGQGGDEFPALGELPSSGRPTGQKPNPADYKGDIERFAIDHAAWMRDQRRR